MRALAPLPNGQSAVVERLRAACEELGREDGLVVGLSDVDRGSASARRRMREAADAARIGRSLVADGGAVCYQELGAYRYLVHLDLDEAPRDRYRAAVEQLGDYDRRRGARLVETLEQFLADRGSVTASAGRSTCTRTRCASGSSGSSASAASTCPTRTCSRWSWR